MTDDIPTTAPAAGVLPLSVGTDKTSQNPDVPQLCPLCGANDPVPTPEGADGPPVVTCSKCGQTWPQTQDPESGPSGQDDQGRPTMAGDGAPLITLADDARNHIANKPLSAADEDTSEPEQFPDVMTLHLESPRTEFKPWPAILAGYPREVSGQPCDYKLKDLIAPGEYRNVPKGFTLSASPDRLKRWCDTGNKMLAAGVRVPIVCDHSEKARDAVGQIVKFSIDGGRLYGLCQFIGPDAPLLAACNDVSIGVNEHFIDGKNRDWGDAIVHVALTPVPVVPDQNAFIQAASRAAAADAGDLLTLAASTPATSPEGNVMPTLNCSEECMSALHKLVPGLAAAHADEKMSRVAQHLHTMAAMDDADAGGSDAVSTMSREQITTTAQAKRKEWRERNVALTNDLAAERNRVTELSRKLPTPLGEEAEGMALDALRIEGEQLVRECSLSPACKETLLGVLGKTSDGKVNTLALSRAANPAGDKALAFAVLAALRGNRPVEPGSTTAMQTMSRTAPGADAPAAPKPIHEVFMEFAGQATKGTKL